MKKFGTWCLNHLGLLLGIVVFGVTFAIIGVTMLNSHNAYIAYEKQFNQTDLEVRSVSAAQPKLIEMNDAFKSEYKNKLSLAADELNVSTSQAEYLNDDYIDLTEKGGTISVKLSLEEKSFVDIDFEIATEYVKAASGDEEEQFGIQDLLSNVQFTVNGETMEEEGVELVEEGWHHLVMVSFALPEGEVSVEMKSTSGKTALMPQLRSMTFFSSAVLSIAEEAAE
jgi:hypothetical protein